MRKIMQLLRISPFNRLPRFSIMEKPSGKGKCMSGSSKEREEEWRELIFDAYNRCIEQGSAVSEITIKRICEEAHISKPTFYRYFDNKEDMSLWACKRAVDAGFSQIGRTCTWFVGLYRTCLSFLHYRAFFSASPATSLDTALGSTIFNYKRDALMETLTKYRRERVDSVMAFQIESFLISSSSLFRYWGESGMNMSPEDIAAYITSAVPWGLFNALKEPLRGLSDEQHHINRIAITSVKGRPVDYWSLRKDTQDGSDIIKHVMNEYGVSDGGKQSKK